MSAKPAPDDVRQRYRDALAVPEYRAITVSYLVTMVGMIMADFATSVLVYRRTGSPLLTTLVLALAFMPYLFAGTMLSALVDRVPSRRLLVGCNLLTVVITLTMSVPGMPVGALLALVFCNGLVAPVFAGTRAATLPDVLPPAAYIPGRSLFRVISQGSQVGGLAVGGALLSVVSAQASLRLEAGAFLLSAVVLRLGTRPRPPAAGAGGGGSLVGESLGALRAVLADPPLRRLMLLSWLVPLVSVAPEALAVPYAHERGYTTAQLGVMMAVLPLGNTLAEVVGVTALTPARQNRLLVPLCVLVVAPMVGYGLHPTYPVTMALLLASGLGFISHLGLDRRLIETAPESLRARALSLQNTGMMFWQGLGFVLPGLAAQFVAPATVVAVTGLAGLGALALWGMAGRGPRFAQA